MTVIVLYLVTAAVFLVLDALMLTFVISPMFRAELGEALLAAPRLWAAGLFYLVYVGGLVYLVSLPALRNGAPVILPALVLGAMAYGTYEFTNYATLRAWTVSMMATDFVWGTVLTAVSAWAGVAAARRLLG
ncbi:MAG: DUF2177 family protein [Rhodobacteraceae bacterium]|nr:DUF2177 family protein [Paracoccaceae bacterium]